MFKEEEQMVHSNLFFQQNLPISVGFSFLTIDNNQLSAWKCILLV